MGAINQALASYSAASGGSAPSPGILWWKMNDGSGTTVTADVGPNGTTDASWVTGASGSGSALDFNGTNDDAFTVSSINYGVNIITITFWAYFDDTTSTGVIVENGNPNYFSQAYGFILFVDAGNLYAGINGNTALTSRSEYCTAPATGSWKFIAAILDGSTTTGNTDIYIDAVPQGTTVAVNAHAGTGSFATQVLNVGARTSAYLFMDGKLEDLQIHSGALTGDQISAIYAAGAQ